MSFKVRCDCCHKELNRPGALIFGPPEEDGTVLKEHICYDCYDSGFPHLYQHKEIERLNVELQKAEAELYKLKAEMTNLVLRISDLERQLFQ